MGFKLIYVGKKGILLLDTERRERLSLICQKKNTRKKIKCETDIMVNNTEFGKNNERKKSFKDRVI